MTVDYRELTVRTMDELLLDFDGDLTEQRKMKNLIWSIWWRLRRIGLDDLLPEVINFIITPRAPADGSVTMEKLAQDVIDFILTPRAPADNSVNTQHLVDKSVTINKLGDDVINFIEQPRAPADKSVTIQKLGDDVLNLINEIGQLAAEQILFGCLPMEFPPATNAESIQYLVQSREASGCVRIARYSPGASAITLVSTNSVWGSSEPIERWWRPEPNESTPGVHIYESHAAGLAILNGTFNRSIFEGPGGRNVLAQATFTIASPRVISIDFQTQVFFEPGSAKSSWVFMEVDGVLPTDFQGYTAGLGIITNYVFEYRSTTNYALPAGTHTIRFVHGSYFTNPPARLVVVKGPDYAMGSSWHFRTAIL